MISKVKKNNKFPIVNESEYLKVEADAHWLHRTIGKAFYDDDYHRIIEFFVLHSPCKISSYTPYTLESLGWKNHWQSSSFRKIFDEVAGFVDGDTYRYHDSKNHFLKMWNDTDYSEFVGVKKEFAVFIYAGETNPRMDLLHHIRNAFAHGRFTVIKHDKEYYIYFEDVTEMRNIKGLVVTARICLKKTTLIEWLNIFEKKSEKAKSMTSLYVE